MPQRDDSYRSVPGECPLCGYPMDGYQCRLTCPNCGYSEDCSDTFTAGPMEPPKEVQAAGQEEDRRQSG